MVGIRCKDGVVLVSGPFPLRPHCPGCRPLLRLGTCTPPRLPAPFAYLASLCIPCAHPQGAEKLIVSKMLEAHSNRRTFPVDRHAGVAIAGVAADGRAIVNKAMSEANSYK